MASEKVEFLSAVLLISKDPARLGKFYKDVIGLPIEEEEHGESLPHFGCELGDLHFAIHPPENFEDKRLGVGSIKLAFNIFDLGALCKRIEDAGLSVEYPPKDTGFSMMTALYDPDGNYIELTHLSDRWFQHLESRKAAGHDVVAKWKEFRRQK